MPASASPRRTRSLTVQRPGLRQQGRQARKGRDTEIRQRQAEAERREDQRDLHRPPGEREADRRADEGRGAGGRQQRRQQAGEERAAPDPARKARRRNLEQAPEIGREQQQQEQHRREEDRLLELDAPADRHAGLRRRDRRAGQQPEGKDDCPRRDRQEFRPRPATPRPAKPGNMHELDAQHRQHAGHEIEDDAAGKRQRQDDSEAVSGLPARRRHAQALLHGPAPADDGCGQCAADQRLGPPLA